MNETPHQMHPLPPKGCISPFPVDVFSSLSRARLRAPLQPRLVRVNEKLSAVEGDAILRRFISTVHLDWLMIFPDGMSGKIISLEMRQRTATLHPGAKKMTVVPCLRR